MAQQFRKILEQFYCKINSTAHLDVYKKILCNQFDEIEVEPIHILTLRQQPSFKDVEPRKKKQNTKQLECLYKNSDFASVFLFGYLLEVLKRPQNDFLKVLEDRTFENIREFYGEQTSEEAVRYNIFFEELFEFLNFITARQYQIFQIQQLFKAFYNNSIERKGLKKTDKQRYGTEAQTILSFILGRGGQYPSRRQVIEPTSDAYQLNELNFCINIQNINQNEQWTIGEGQNHINIIKDKNQYSVLEEQKVLQDVSQEQQLNEAWLKILEESQKLKEQQSSRTSKLFTDLNIAQCKSPTKSARPPMSANLNNNGIRRAKNNFI